MAAPAKGTMNLAARMGRWSAQHRKKAIWGWLVFVFLAFVIGGAVGTKTQDAAQSGVGESGRAERTIDNAFPKHQVEQVLIQSDSSTATDPSFRGRRRRRAAPPGRGSVHAGIREPLRTRQRRADLG